MILSDWFLAGFLTHPFFQENVYEVCSVGFLDLKQRIRQCNKAIPVDFDMQWPVYLVAAQSKA